MIFPQTATFILREHKHRPIRGELLLIGRQTVALTIDAALELIEAAGVQPNKTFTTEIDRQTVGLDGREFITDRCFFSMFTSANVRALDVSAYEGAEIIHDLNAPAPPELHGIADFIFNGSCLDNLFDPATAVKALSKMLRPGGRIIHVEHGTAISGAYLCYSPEWFFDFYAVNDYQDCQLLFCTFPDGLHGDWYLFRWLPYVENDGKLQTSRTSLAVGDFVDLVIAEKGSASSDDRVPIQAHYRTMHDGDAERPDPYREKFLQFEASPRNVGRVVIGEHPDIAVIGKLLASGRFVDADLKAENANPKREDVSPTVLQPSSVLRSRLGRLKRILKRILAILHLRAA